MISVTKEFFESNELNIVFITEMCIIQSLTWGDKLLRLNFER